MTDAVARLESEYCPPIDSALFYALVSDFDLTDDNAVTAARATLDAIKISALEQDSVEFDPSGGSVEAARVENETPIRTGEATSETGASRSDETDLTSLSDGLDNGYIAEADKLDDRSKVILLKEMFPGLTEFTISNTLKKRGANWTRTLEELLNRTFFDEQEPIDGEARIVAKGVEAFSEDNIIRRGRFKKQKQQRMIDRSEAAVRSSSVPTSQSISPWEKVGTDIEFLRSRTSAPHNIISSAYHKNGASLPATIIALLEMPLPTQPLVASTDPAIQTGALELGKDFPALDAKHVAGIVRLTHPSTAAAHELAKALAAPLAGNRGAGIEVIPRYAPIDIDDSDSNDNDNTWTAARNRRKSRSGISTPSSSSGDPQAVANGLLDLQQRSFAQASAAYRRGKSDHLMSGAAAYYSQQGRDFALQRAEATAEAADALVDSQSSNDEIDLHGVSVKDGVRIAKAKTEIWWRMKKAKVMGLDGRVREEGNEGRALRIVTGVGRHSAGGRAKVGPAVARMLFVEGWNVSVGEGVLTVYGKKR